MRWKRYTGVPGLERSVSDSSGVTVPADLRSHTLRGLRPRARMSSENEVSLEKFFSTRAHTKVPDPWRRTNMPFADQAVDRLAHRDARDAEIHGEIALGRQRIVRT